MIVRLVGLTLIGCILAVIPETVLAQEEWGHLTGRFVVKGQIPEATEEVVDKDAATCMPDGKTPKDDNLIVDKDGGLRDVFVMMFIDRGDKAPAVHPSYEAKKGEAITLDNVQCRFEPHAVFVRTGQKLTLKNSDDVGHNCHVITFGNEENVNLAAGGNVDVIFKKADKVPGNVVCDIHKWMDGVILVRDEPYAAISNADGNFKIENVPAGKWKFQLWHKKVGFLRDIDVKGTKTGRRGEVELAIDNNKTLELGDLIIDAKIFDAKK